MICHLLGSAAKRKSPSVRCICQLNQAALYTTGPKGSPENPAAVLYGPHDLRYEQHDLPAVVPPGHLRIRIRATGICGSDLHFYEKGRIGKFKLEHPMVTGHESAGQVAAVGAGVDRLTVGARVALEPGVPCWGSTMARQGRYNLDPAVRFFATPPVHGSLCKFVDHPEDFCHPLPDALSYEEGAMIEPLSNALFACKRAGVAPGKSVAVLGAGTMGLLTLASARAFGASRVAITDIRDDNLALAKRMGATFPLLTPPSMGFSEAATLLKGCFPPEGPDCIIDCAGYESTVQTGMEALARGGTFALVGMGAECCSFPMTTLITKEADVKGCFRYTNIYPTAIELVEEGRIDVKPLITHRFAFSGLQDVLDGFQCAIDMAKTKAIKVMYNLPV